MAGTWRIHLETEVTLFDVTHFKLRGDAARRVVIEGIEVQGLGTKPRTKTRYCRAATSDISGYKKLLPDNSNDATEYNAGTVSAVFKPLTTVLIQEFATDPGDIGSFDWNRTIRNNLQLSGRFTKADTPLIPTVRRIKIEYIHRDASGGETILATDTTSNFDSLGASEVKLEEFNPVSQTFERSDRLVLKFYAQFQNL